jgi:hypothetical protein
MMARETILSQMWISIRRCMRMLPWILSVIAVAATLALGMKQQRPESAEARGLTTLRDNAVGIVLIALPHAKAPQAVTMTCIAAIRG